MPNWRNWPTDAAARETRRRGQAVFPAVFIAEIDGFFEADQMIAFQSAIQIQQIGAAAQQHMLAVVDLLTRLGIDEGTGPTAEGFSGFDQRDAQTGGFQGDGGGDAGDTAADDEG